MDWADRVGSHIKLRDLHILLAVVEWKSMAEAARHLAVSQPVVSRAIADLEHALGIQLLDRTPHSIAACHAQMARDVLVKAICPEIAFVAGCDVGVAQ